MRIALIIIILIITRISCEVPPNSCNDNEEYINGSCNKCKPGKYSGGGYPCMSCFAGTYFAKPNNCNDCGEGMTSLEGGFCFVCPSEAKINKDKVCECPSNYQLTDIASTPKCILKSKINQDESNSIPTSANIMIVGILSFISLLLCF